MDLKSTVVFEKNYDALYNNEARFIINEGGSRSSKTYSLCQLILVYCLQNKGVVVSIIRKTFPALRATAMRDFLEVLKIAGGRIWRGDKALELGLVDKLGSLDDAINSMVTKLELEDYKAFSYNNEVEFEDYLNSLTKDILPVQIQGLLNKISGLNRMFLSEKERYIVAYCFDCGLRSFE